MQEGTAGKHSDEAFRASELRYRRLFEAAQDGILILDAKTGQIDDVNPFLLRLLGYSYEEFVGKRLWEIGPFKNIKECTLALQELQEKEHIRYEYLPLETKGGRSIAVEFVSNVYELSGGTQVIQCNIRDVSERRQAEEALRESEETSRLTFEQAAVGIGHLAPDGSWLRVNDKLCAIVGYTREELVGMSFQAITHPDDLATDLDSLSRLLQGEIGTYSREKRYIAKNGNIVWVALNMSTVRGTDGKPLFFVAIIEDITRRQEAEQARQKAEAELQALIESTDDLIWSAGVDCRLLTSNRATQKYVERQFGSRVGVGMMPEDCLAPPAAEKWRSFHERVLRGGAFQEEYQDRDGRTFAMSFNPIVNGGATIGVAAFGRDITKQKAAQESLAEAERNYRGIINNSPLGFYRTTPEGAILMVNPALIRILGYESAEELLALNLSTGRFAPDYSRTEFKRELEEKGIVRGLETAWQRLDGTFVYLRETARAIRDDAGRIVFYEGVVEDVTERWQAEEKYKTIFEGAMEGIYRTTPDGRPLHVNPALARMLGYASVEESLSLVNDIGTQVWANPEERERLIEMLRDKHDARHYQCQLKRKDGSLLWVALSSHLVFGPDGEPLYSEGFVEDISELKASEAEREKVANEFIQAQKMEAVGRLAGGIAHDFNNLLMVIMAQTELLRAGLEGAAVHRAESVMSSARRAAELTGQLLAFSRKQTTQPGLTSMNQLVNNIHDMLRRLMGEDIDVKFALHNEPWPVKVDRTQFEQAIMNLAINARDAMPGGGRLTIETGNAEIRDEYVATHPLVPFGKYAMLALTDTGTGMSAEVQARLFEPFFTTKEQGKGTGLGLSMVYGIVKQCGGFIWVYSEVGKGTCFKIYLPRAEMSEHKALEVPAAPTQSIWKNGTILLVEDDEGLRDLISDFLGSGGHKTIVADSVDEACRVAEEHRQEIDLLLTDVILKGGNAKQLVDRLNDQGCTFRVVYMSGYPRDGIAQHGALDAGTLFLQKPFSRSALLDKVEEALLSGS